MSWYPHSNDDRKGKENHSADAARPEPFTSFKHGSHARKAALTWYKTGQDADDQSDHDADGRIPQIRDRVHVVQTRPAELDK